MFEKSKRCALASMLVAAVVTLGPGAASSTPIDPGFDLFSTVGPTFVDLGGTIGIVGLEGVPIGPGTTDTIVERKEGLASGTSGTIDIELVALSLRSVAPVNIGGTLFDLDVISGSLLGEPDNPLGNMTITHNDPNGGTFVAVLPVDAKLTFTDVGNPLNTNVQFFNDIFNSQGLWSHTPAAGYPNSSTFPSGGFYPGVDPNTGQPVVTLESTSTLNAEHRVVPAIPEPGTLAILGLGLVGLGVSRRKRVA